MNAPTTTLAERPKQTTKASALAVMASNLSVDPDKLLNTLKNTVFKGASNDELLALVVVANTYHLNPLLKEMYAFPAKGGGIVPVVSIDGWLRIINDHAQMDGMDFEWERDEKGEPISCTAVIYRKDRSHPTKVTEYLSECRRNTEPWKMANRMLRHKAIIQGGRVAFGFGGIYDEDEACDIARNATGTIKVEQAKPVFASEPKSPALMVVTEDDLPMDFETVSTASRDVTTQDVKAEPSTPQEQLGIAVADFGCPEHTFMQTFAKMSPSLVKSAETIRDLSDKAANAALKEIDTLLAATEEGK